jgi:hypothetical protein
MTGGAELCAHHHSGEGDDWAVANRIMCDLVHRKRTPARLVSRDRDDDFWGDRERFAAGAGAAVAH